MQGRKSKNAVRLADEIKNRAGKKRRRGSRRKRRNVSKRMNVRLVDLIVTGPAMQAKHGLTSCPKSSSAWRVWRQKIKETGNGPSLG